MRHSAGSYVCDIHPAAELPQEIIQQMAAIYLGHYDGSSEALFLHDLAKKDDALLLYTGDELVGFTTLRVFDAQWQGRPIRVVYSGDTIVERAHWGQQKLAFAWIERIGAIKRQAPTVPLYWLLLVKGHRTYKYLSTFGKSFHPHWQQNRGDLKPLADQLAADLFGPDYNPMTSVVEFPESRGHLKPSIACPAESELAKPGTRFFLQANPGYLRGHELVCLCELEIENMKPLTARIFESRATEGAQ